MSLIKYLFPLINLPPVIIVRLISCFEYANLTSSARTASAVWPGKGQQNPQQQNIFSQQGLNAVFVGELQFSSLKRNKLSLP